VAILLVCSTVIGQPASPIWDIVGGQVGIGSLYNVVTEQLTFPAYEFHYDTQNTMVINGQPYLIPDEVFGYSSPEYTNDSRLLLVDSLKYFFNDYVSTWGISAGINIDGISLNLAFSHTAGQINAILNSSVNSFAQNILSWNQFVVEMWPGEAQLSQHFQSYLDQLPQQYIPSVYRQFVEEFGTHIIYKSCYGARINFTAQFHASLVDTKGIKWVQNQVSLAVGWMEFKVGINWQNFDNKTQIDNTFLENSDNLTLIAGGQPNVLQGQGFNAWWQTVDQDFAVLYPESSIMPLYEVVKDPVIANNLKQAIIAYGTGQAVVDPPRPIKPVNIVN